MDDLISKDRLMEALGISDDCVNCQHKLNGLCLWKPNMVDVCEIITEMPSAEPIDVPEKDVGKWTEKEVIHADEAKEIITEWQSCKCSICGRYDTRPYLYYFDEPRFCSWCGVRMKGARK